MREDMPGFEFYDIDGQNRNSAKVPTNPDTWDLASDPKYKYIKEQI